MDSFERDIVPWELSYIVGEEALTGTNLLVSRTLDVVEYGWTSEPL